MNSEPRIISRRTGANRVAPTSHRSGAGKKQLGEVVVDQAAAGRLVLLDGRQHHRAKCRLRNRVSCHDDYLFKNPASTGKVTPVM